MSNPGIAALSSAIVLTAAAILTGAGAIASPRDEGLFAMVSGCFLALVAFILWIVNINRLEREIPRKGE